MAYRNGFGLKAAGTALALGAITAFGALATATPAEAGRKTGFQNSKLAKYGYAPRGYYGHRGGYYRHGGYYRGHRGNGGLAAGVGIAAGLLAVGAAAGAFGQPAYAEPVYQQPAYGYGYGQPVYYRQPVCRIRHQTVWDPYYGYVRQPVEVCR